MANTPRPILEISDGTPGGTIDLLDITGFLLYSWTPSIPEAKNSGVWSDSPLFSGRKLAYRQMGNTSDVFELKIVGGSQDNAIQKLQELRRLLEKATTYWLSDSQNVPVFIRARAAFETNVRYCTIHDYRTPRDGDPFAQPFFSCNPLLDNFLLAIEHGPWQATPPGEATCVEISGQQAYEGGVAEVTDSPEASTDDGYTTLGAMNLVAANIWVGQHYDGDKRNLGIRFVTVNIPAGATILNAKIDFVSTSNSPDKPCATKIYGNDVDDAAIFSTYADYIGRAVTSAYVAWSIPPTTLGAPYSTPDITTIIQEIVNRGGWASGNEIAILIKDDGSPLASSKSFASWNHTTLAEPRLWVKFTTFGNSTFGQEATCENGAVFAANKYSQAGLTHIYHYDASITTFSSNLLGAATPFAFLPAVPAANDLVYFGSTDGPFASIVFDITQNQAFITSAVWEYYNGATWATLTVQDNTYNVVPFNLEGILSVHFAQPSNWTTVAINGATAYWVRVRVVSVGASPTPPYQGNRDIYTIVWPYVDIQADQVGGDIPALTRILLANKSDAPSGSPVLHANRIIIGSRSLSRGEDFVAYLNVSDEQDVPGVTVALGSNSAFSNAGDTPTGRRCTYTSPGGAGATTEVTITLNSIISQEYLGRFRAFLRYKYNTGTADAVSMRLVTTPGGSGLAKYSDYIFPQNNTDRQVADLGIVNIQPRSPGDEYGSITFAIEITRDTSGRVIYLYDLILMPVDEWSTDAVDESGLAARTGAVGNGDMLDIDSVTYPRQVDQAILRELSAGRMIGYFQNRQAGPALLQSNAAQRLWFFSLLYESGTELSSPRAIAHTVQVFCAQRYHSQRGRR